MNQPNFRQWIVPDGPALCYELDGLKELAHYEVRISYPATHPARFRFRWPTGDRISSGAARALLNADKVMFFTDSQADVVVDGVVRENWLEIYALADGRSPEVGMLRDPVPFSIVLESLGQPIPLPHSLIGTTVGVGVLLVIVLSATVYVVLRESR